MEKMKRRTHIIPLVLATIFAAAALSSCGGRVRTIVVWTDRAEIASYADRFNVEQEDVRAVVVYKERPATDLPPAQDELPPDVIVGSFLMNSRVQSNFSPLDTLLGERDEEGKLDPRRLEAKTFYEPLLEYGRDEGTQYLLPVSFNLPIIAFSERNVRFVPNPHTLELEELRDAAGAFNAKSRAGVYTQMGFAPSWNADFIYAAAKMDGAEFMEIGRSFGWNVTALERTMAFMQEWTREKNSSSEAEQDFSFKYLYTPPYKQIASGRCLFAYSTTDKFFSLAPEQIEGADFRWLTKDGEIFVEDNITTAGIHHSSGEKAAARTFLRWLLSEDTQKALLARDEQMKLSTRTFGICCGFSSLRAVNERHFPAHYKTLLGNLPGEDSMRIPLPLPPRWGSLKQRVLIPYLSDAAKTEPPHKMQTIDERLKVWTKQFN